MKLFNSVYQPGDNLTAMIHKQDILDDNLVVLVFSDCDPKAYRNNTEEQEQVLQVIRQLKQLLPKSVIAGVTTAGAFNHGKIEDKNILLSFLQFDATVPMGGVYPLEKFTPSETAHQIHKDLITPDTGLLLLFTDGFHTDAHHLLDELSALAPDLPVAGGKAGDGLRFMHTSIFYGAKAFQKGTVAIALNGEALRVHQFYRLNWKKIGKAMTITDAKENVVNTIDGEPALQVYQRYLGHDITNKLTEQGGTEFPLFFQRKGMKITRGVIGQDTNGGIHYAGDIHTGEQVHFSYGHIPLIFESLEEDCRQAASFEPQGVLVFSCAARKSLLQDQAAAELLPLAQQAPLTGLFTYGEFYHLNQRHHLLNMTMTVTLLSEEKISQKKESPMDIFYVNSPVDHHYIRIVKALTHLTETVTTELEESKLKLEEQNYLLSQLLKIDGLTKLYNHKHFHQSLEWETKAALRYHRDLCVGMIDLDNFKDINDTYGHGIGDQVLIQLAELLKSNCRDTDIVGRYGGDEFAVVLPETKLEEGAFVFERIRKKVASTRFGTHQLHMALSCGIAQLDPSHPNDLLSKADQRLYIAKKRGGNLVISTD